MTFFQIENLGIDWNGPVGLNDDTAVTVDDVESLLSQEEKTLLDLFLAAYLMIRKVFYIINIYFANLS